VHLVGELINDISHILLWNHWSVYFSHEESIRRHVTLMWLAALSSPCVLMMGSVCGCGHRECPNFIETCVGCLFSYQFGLEICSYVHRSFYHGTILQKAPVFSRWDGRDPYLNCYLCPGTCLKLYCSMHDVHGQARVLALNLLWLGLWLVALYHFEKFELTKLRHLLHFHWDWLGNETDFIVNTTM